MSSLLLLRISIAAIWFYQGLWCKLFGRMARHEEIVGSVPFLGASRAHAMLVGLGCVECLAGACVLSGLYPRETAFLQTLLLMAMNGGGLLWARRAIPDPAGMLLQNFAFLLLVWIAAGELHPYAA